MGYKYSWQCRHLRFDINSAESFDSYCIKKERKKIPLDDFLHWKQQKWRLACKKCVPRFCYGEPNRVCKAVLLPESLLKQNTEVEVYMQYKY